ncbi:MAG TPA: twin-arginine translocase subunit TatC [Rhodobacteraceae bacterium]|nr:twin-arginine translocase subunit TatC [Paracoccaceae bacterium]
MTDEVESSAAPLIEHLTELRNRIIYSVIAFLIGMVISFTVWQPILDILTQPLCDAMQARGEAGCGLILIKLQEGFFVAVSISLLGGLILSFPYISYQMWRFVAPGLYKNEKNAFLPFLFASPVMFFLGASFAFFVVMPMAFNFFLGFQQSGFGGADTGSVQASVDFQGSLQEYLRLTIKFIVAFGLCFQLPVLLTLMGKAGLVSASGLKAVRKYAIVGILVLAAIVTPPDVITQVILFSVVYGLYEVSIQLVARVERKREAKLRAEGLWFEDDEDEDEEDPMMAEFEEDEGEEGYYKEDDK